MKQLTSYVIETLKINKNTKINKFTNNIDINQLEYFTKYDIDKIFNWINNDMPKDIIPIVVTNVRNPHQDWLDPNREIFLLYDEDYKNKGVYDIPYIRFFNDNKEGLVVTIYDPVKEKYYSSEVYHSIKDLNKCFNYIESKHDIIKDLI